MRSSIGRRRHLPGVRLLLLASLLLLSVAPAVPVDPRPGTPVSPPPPGRVLGSGSFDMLACLGCASVVVGLGGTTVLGVVGFLSAWPEVGIGCGLACYRAFW